MIKHCNTCNATDRYFYLLKLGLFLFTGMFATAKVLAADPQINSFQVSMITQPDSRDSVNVEIKVLEDEYINDVVKALYKEKSGPDYSREDVYVDYLVQVIEGNTRKDLPNFADDDVYVDHLVEILKMQ